MGNSNGLQTLTELQPILIPYRKYQNEDSFQVAPGAQLRIVFFRAEVNLRKCWGHKNLQPKMNKTQMLNQQGLGWKRAEGPINRQGERTPTSTKQTYRLTSKSSRLFSFINELFAGAPKQSGERLKALLQEEANYALPGDSRRVRWQANDKQTLPKSVCLRRSPWVLCGVQINKRARCFLLINGLGCTVSHTKIGKVYSLEKHMLRWTQALPQSTFFHFIKHWFSRLLQTPKKKQFVYVVVCFFCDWSDLLNKKISANRGSAHAHIRVDAQIRAFHLFPHIFALRPATLLITSPEGCLSRITKFFFFPPSSS